MSRYAKYGDVSSYLVVTDALIKGLGYTTDAACKAADDFADKAIENHSDHAAYRELADKLTEFIGQVWPDPNDIDGDSSELALLCDFLGLAKDWLPDLIRHQEAEKLRKTEVGDLPDVGEHQHFVRFGFNRAADQMDPFQRSAAGEWTRKSDGAAVPWQVLND